MLYKNSKEKTKLNTDEKIYGRVDVFNLLYILKPPTSLARQNGSNNGPRWVLYKGQWKPKIKKSFKIISLVVDKFFKARTWRHSNIQTGKCFLIIFFPSILIFFSPKFLPLSRLIRLPLQLQPELLLTLLPVRREQPPLFWAPPLLASPLPLAPLP